MSPSADPRTSLQLMFRGEFAVAFWGKLVLQTGIWAQLMVCVILAFDRTGSAAWVGAVGAAQMVPQLGLALVSGSMSDRYGPAKPISAGGLIVGLGCLGLAGWLNSSLTSSGSAVPILVSSIVIGVGIALSASALQTVPPLLARPNELSAAVGLNFIPTTLARTAGPVVGSLSTATLGYPTTLLIVSATSTLTAAGFLRLRGLRGPTVGKGDHRGIGTVMRYVWADGRLLGLLGGVAAIGAASEAPITLAPAMAAHLEMHGVGVGWITSAFGLGGILGVVAHRVCSRVLQPRSEGCAAMLLFGVSLALVGVGSRLWLVTIALLVAGAGMVQGITAFSLAVQSRSPSAMLGRIMALWVLAFAGVRPISSLAIGFVADHHSVQVAMLGAGLFSALATVAVLFTTKAKRDSAESAPLTRSGRAPNRMVS